MISRVEKRDIVITLLLSFITCGIYGIAWFVMLTNDCGKASGDDSISGGTSLLLALITCGIYYIYWSYQMGKKIVEAQTKRNLIVTDNSVLYLILTIFGFGLVTQILIQSEINNLASFDHTSVA